MSDIEEWNGDEVPEDIPDVVPEALLWQVFARLVDAIDVLHEGAGVEVPGKSWRTSSIGIST